jgi:hypothetical protein
MIDSGEMVGELVAGMSRCCGLWLRCIREGGGPRTECRIGQKRAGAGSTLTGKRRGEIGEAVFLAKVSALGFGVSKTWGTASGMTLWWMELRGCGGCRSSQRTGQARMAVTASIPAGTPWSLIDRMRLMRYSLTLCRKRLGMYFGEHVCANKDDQIVYLFYSPAY